MRALPRLTFTRDSRTVTQRISGRLSEIDSPLTESVSRFKNNEDADDSASSSAEDSDQITKFYGPSLETQPRLQYHAWNDTTWPHGTYR